MAAKLGYWDKDRLEELKKRKVALLSMMVDEEQADDRSEIYIKDLQDSIDNCESQIRFLEVAGPGYQVINGAR